MRLVGGIVALAALGAAASGGGGYLLARGAQAALAQHPGQVTATALAPAGFPLALGVSAQGLSLADLREGVSWQTPAAQLSAPLWAPLDWQITAQLPQKLTLAGHSFTLTAQETGARIGLGLGTDLPLRRAQITLVAPRLTHEKANTSSLAATRISGTAEETETGRYALNGEISALALPPGLSEKLAPGAALPDLIESVTLTAQAGFDRPFALATDAEPRLETLDLEKLALDWGGHALTATGALTIDAHGFPEGRITVATQDWAAWLRIAHAAGLVSRDELPLLTSLGTYLAAQSPEGRVEVPLAFAAGLMSLGPVPFGPAPRLAAQRQ